MIIRESHHFWSDKYNVLDWPHIQLLLTGSILSWNKPLAPNLKFSVTLLHHKLKTEKQRERNNAITSTFKITNDQFQSRRNSDCLVFMWHSSSQLTGQEHNVTPGDKSGRGKSTCRVGQVWDKGETSVGVQHFSTHLLLHCFKGLQMILLLSVYVSTRIHTPLMATTASAVR